METSIKTENIENTYEYTRFLTEDCFPRLTGASGNKKATQKIKQDMEDFCDSSEFQTFDHHPTAFLKFLIPTSIMFYSSLFLMAFNVVTINLVMYLVGVTMFVSQFITYKGWFDILFKKETGVNVIGTIEPEHEVKQQIILTGHHDAPYVFHIIEKMPRFYAAAMALSILMAVIGLVGTLIWQVDIIFPQFSLSDRYYSVYKIIMYSGSIFMLPFFVFTTKKVSPGAGDNAIAVGLIMEIAKKYGLGKKNGGKSLQHTRLIIAALDAEECGLRGARAYVAQNKEKFQKIKTYNFNIDSIFKPENLTFFTRDLNTFVPLSKTEAEFCQDIAQEQGHPIRLSMIPFGGGATDATEFARAGVDAISLVGTDAEVIGKKMDYHTERDTMAVISKDSIRIILEVLDTYIHKRDNELDQV